MYYYFSSSFPAILKLNGNYFGQINDTVKFCDIDSDQTFVEVCSLSHFDNGLNFILNNQFLDSPLDKYTVTDMKGGYLINFNRDYLSSQFKVIQQKQFGNLLATVFSDGTYKISLQTSNDFFVENIPSIIESSEFNFIYVDNTPLLIVDIKGSNPMLCVYLVQPKIIKAVAIPKHTFSCKDNEFITTERLDDIAKHTITTMWQVNDNKLVAKERKVEKNKLIDLTKINPLILPYVFLEEFGVGGDCTEFLADNIKENAPKLKGYLGEFIGVMPPPKFREIDEVGLIYKCGKNKYYVDYFKFEISSKKITNIKKCDD